MVYLHAREIYRIANLWACVTVLSIRRDKYSWVKRLVNLVTSQKCMRRVKLMSNYPLHEQFIDNTSRALKNISWVTCETCWFYISTWAWVKLEVSGTVSMLQIIYCTLSVLKTSTGQKTVHHYICSSFSFWSSHVKRYILICTYIACI